MVFSYSQHLVYWFLSDILFGSSCCQNKNDMTMLTITNEYDSDTIVCMCLVMVLMCPVCLILID